ncbi:MAG: Hpt domain-containing protein [Flavobacteriaceae bacterium]
MSDDTDHQPTIEDDGYERVEVPKSKRLESAVVPGIGPAIDPEALNRAEQAQATLSVQFTHRLTEEISRLGDGFTAAEKSPCDQDTVLSFFRSAHDLRGQAATLGYPLVGEVAGSICRLIEAMEEGDELPVDLIRHHVDAIRAIAREHVRDATDETGLQLAKELRRVADRFIEERQQDEADAEPDGEAAA